MAQIAGLTFTIILDCINKCNAEAVNTASVATALNHKLPGTSVQT